MSRAADLLRQVHALRLELEALGADAGVTITITVSPLNQRAGQSSTAQGNATRERVLDAFRARPGEWLSLAADVKPVTLLERGTLSRVAGQLHRDGLLEHNGETRGKVRYRLPASSTPPASSPPAAESPPPVDPLTARRDEVRAGTPHGRILLALSTAPATARELAARLDLPLETVWDTLADLDDEDELESPGVRRAGLLGEHVERVYKAARPVAA